MQRTILLLLEFAVLSCHLTAATPIRSAPASSTSGNERCQLTYQTVSKSQLNASQPLYNIEIGYVNLAVNCVLNNGSAQFDSGPGIAASLSSIRPTGQVWPPPADVSLANVQFALKVLSGLLPLGNDSGRLIQLSMAGLAALPGNAMSSLASTLVKFVDLSVLNVSSIGATSLPAELLSLPRLRRLYAGGNSINCSLDENRWLRLMFRLGSHLVEPADLMRQCDEDDTINSSASTSSESDILFLAANVTEIDGINGDSPEQYSVDLYGEIDVPCSRRYFRSSDAGIWTPDVSIVWRRLDTAGAELLLAASMGNQTDSVERNSTAVTFSASAKVWHPQRQLEQSATRVKIGSAALGAPLMIRGARLAVVGLWRCELVKSGLVLGVRHRLVLKPPLGGLEIVCYIVAASTSVAMVLIGLVAALIRILMRTRCCTRVVHIVEAQSVIHLDASPMQTLRRRQAAADADGSAEASPWLGDTDPTAATTCNALVEISADPSGSGPNAQLGANLRDRIRDINDQMRLRVTNFGETVGSSMRAGWSSGVEHVKEQMRSMAEFCGVNNPPLGQTVSVISIYTDPDGRQEPLEQHLHLLSSV